jgi:hypothetical protein
MSLFSLSKNEIYSDLSSRCLANPPIRTASRHLKPDRRFGFSITLTLTWILKELAVVDHKNMRLFSQPTNEDIFPSFLVESKSEAKCGTLSGPEGQLASAGRSSCQLVDTHASIC